MTVILNILILISLIIVLFVLSLGLYTLISHRQGKMNAKRSNKLMKLRVILQFIAITLIVIIILFKKQSGS